MTSKVDSADAPGHFQGRATSAKSGQNLEHHNLFGRLESGGARSDAGGSLGESKAVRLAAVRTLSRFFSFFYYSQA